MPQMAPMSWITLFIFFSMMLITINTLNYYLFNPKIHVQENSKKSSIMTKTWKW